VPNTASGSSDLHVITARERRIYPAVMGVGRGFPKKVHPGPCAIAHSAIIVLAKRAFYFAGAAELAPNQLHGSDEALGTAAFHAFINVMHKARLIRFGAGKSHGFITLLANGLFGERGGLGHFFKAPIILKILANLQMSESTTAKPDHSRKSNGALEIFPGELPGGRSFQVNFSRMWGSRG
jgi:hypothetical protein